MDQERPPITKLKIKLYKQPTNTFPTLFQHHIERVPAKLLDVLFREYDWEDLDDMGTVVRLNDKKHDDLIKKTVQWITKGGAADFFPPQKLEIRSTSGDQQTMSFDWHKHGQNAAYRATQATHTCFMEELEIYLFSIQTEMRDLQLHVSERICVYPVYAHEVTELLSKLYAKGNEVAKYVDQNLATFIAARINTLRATLVKDNSFLAALRKCIDPRSEVEYLLHHGNVDNAIVEKTLQLIRPTISEANTTDALLRSFENMHLDIDTAPPPDRPPSRPASDRRPSTMSSNNNEEPLAVRDALHILDAIYVEKRVVRMEQNSVGTLVSRPRRRSSIPGGPNSDFRMARGQYVVLLPDTSRFYGPQARVVVNKDGDVGELYENWKLTPLVDIQPVPPPQSPQRPESAKRGRP